MYFGLLLTELVKKEGRVRLQSKGTQEVEDVLVDDDEESEKFEEIVEAKAQPRDIDAD